jgi:hypothetical protein
MNIVDPKGLLEGERLAACSDAAQLHWQRLYVAANGYARLELSYSGIVSHVYRSFKTPPPEDDLWGFFEEYAANFLAVLYEVDGVWWAQFDTSEKYMPRYKTARDENSPAPSVDLLDRHRQGRIEWKRAKSIKNERFQKFSESFINVPKVSAAVAVAVAEKQKDKDISKTSSSHPKASLGDKSGCLEIYSIYPRKEGKQAALKAIEKAVIRLMKGEVPHSPMSRREAVDYLTLRVTEYADSAVGSQSDQTMIPHPSTWFNQGRYDDDQSNWESGDGTGRSPTLQPKSAPKYDTSFDDMVERAKQESRANAYPADASAAAEGFTALTIAKAVCESIPLVGAEIARVVAGVCVAEMKGGREGSELREAMVNAWRDYNANLHKLDCPSGAEKFFGHGIWNNKPGWRWKAGSPWLSAGALAKGVLLPWKRHCGPSPTNRRGLGRNSGL